MVEHYRKRQGDGMRHQGCGALISVMVLWILVFSLMGCYEADEWERPKKKCEPDTVDASAEPLCKEGKTRCLQDMVQVCKDGLWKDYDDCFRRGRTCVLIQGQHTCYQPIDPVSTDPVSGNADVSDGENDNSGAEAVGDSLVGLQGEDAGTIWVDAGQP